MSEVTYEALYVQMTELVGEDNDRDPRVGAAFWIAIGGLCEDEFNDRQRGSFHVARRFWEGRASDEERLTRLEIESEALDRSLRDGDDARQRGLQRIAFASLVRQPGLAGDHFECLVDSAENVGISADRLWEACRPIAMREN